VARFLRGHREESEGPRETHLRQRSQRIVERLERKVVELEEANRNLSEMARLRQEFLQNVSHELATPMTPVVGYLRLLLAEELGPLTSLQRKCLESVQASTQRLRGVVDTLLDVSSLESGRMHFYVREYDFVEITRRAVDDMRAAFDGVDVRLVLEPTPKGLVASGDPDKLRRAMIHVLDNAAKFTPRGGDVAVAIHLPDQDHIDLLVADSGPGVERGDLEKILEPFYQVDGSVTRSHGGVGLGLAFARRVTEAMGGSLSVVSPPDVEVAGRMLAGTLVRLRVAREPEMGPTG
jgi:signal transduction histidine kinase